MTTDPARRLKEHNAGKGGACTRSKRPVRLVFKEGHPSRSSALKREAEIKRWPPKKKEALGLSKEEVFSRLNASAERTLWALQKAYEAGMKEGLPEEGDEDQLIGLLQRAKSLRDRIRQITGNSETGHSQGDSPSAA